MEGVPGSMHTQTRPRPESASMAEVEGALDDVGFAFAPAAVLQQALGAVDPEEWEDFARSWNDLGDDRYMADGGRYRRRRFATFNGSAQGFERKPHQPHYQSREFNPLNGGIDRWFEPVTDAIATHRLTRDIFRVGESLFTRRTPAPLRPEAWHVEMHQFRVEAHPDSAGRPTPEGLHRDGVDWALVVLLRRQNLIGGETEIVDLQHSPVGRFALEKPLDSAWFDDSRVYHGVTAVLPLDPLRHAFRDVLIITFSRVARHSWHA
jgi:hypothetical protein